MAQDFHGALTVGAHARLVRTGEDAEIDLA
jgi:hypothetical protein